MELSTADLEDLRFARTLLESENLAVKISKLLGVPIEKGFKMLPPRWAESVQEATRSALGKALEFSVRTLGTRPRRFSSEGMHRLMAAASGAAGGALGMAALAVELPVSTVIMLRSIADIARSEGEDLAAVETKLGCLEVFALGGKSHADEAAETGYFAVRLALARQITEAVAYLAQRGTSESGAPVLVRFIGSIAARFGAVVSDKVAAQAVPIIGAAGGALINTLFINHFQDVARGHFIVRRLERAYDPESVRALYEGREVS
jgi:hypothetical protein